MRDIRFRAWDYQRKQMLDFDLDDAHKIIPYTDSPIMQYTGLKDKHGKEIWEGDIMQSYDGVGDVYYDAPSFRVRGEYEEVFSGCHDEWVVLGNIYEHPDLLK